MRGRKRDRRRSERRADGGMRMESAAVIYRVMRRVMFQRSDRPGAARPAVFYFSYAAAVSQRLRSSIPSHGRHDVTV